MASNPQNKPGRCSSKRINAEFPILPSECGRPRPQQRPQVVNREESGPHDSYEELRSRTTAFRCLSLNHLLPGFSTGIVARSAGNLFASKVSTFIFTRLNMGTPN